MKSDKPTRSDWQAAASKEVKGKDIVWHTPEGIEVVGTCALLAEHDGARELVKMAVKESAKGRGVGRALGEAAIAAARADGVARVELMSNTKLAPAIALYRRLGFVEVPMPVSDYERANIAMELRL